MKQKIFYGYSFIFEQSISVQAKLIFLYLCKFADRAGKCFPSVRSMAQCCNISKRSIFDHMRFLENEKIVSRDRRFRHDGTQTSNWYQINKLKDAWFTIPSMIFELEISAQAKLVYMYLCYRANKENTCFPSRKAICEACTVGKTKLAEVLDELEQNGLLKKEIHFRDKRRGQTSNLYTILDIECA